MEEGVDGEGRRRGEGHERRRRRRRSRWGPFDSILLQLQRGLLVHEHKRINLQPVVGGGDDACGVGIRGCVVAASRKVSKIRHCIAAAGPAEC